MKLRPARRRARGLARLTSAPCRTIDPALYAREPGDRFAELGLTVAVDARDAEDLAAMDLKLTRSRRRRPEASVIVRPRTERAAGAEASR